MFICAIGVLLVLDSAGIHTSIEVLDMHMEKLMVYFAMIFAVVLEFIQMAFNSRLNAWKKQLADEAIDAAVREVEGGGTIADIAHSLHLSQGTVRNHVSSAMLKMDARTRAEAASLARAAGWL